MRVAGPVSSSQKDTHSSQGRALAKPSSWMSAGEGEKSGSSPQQCWLGAPQSPTYSSAQCPVGSCSQGSLITESQIPDDLKLPRVTGLPLPQEVDQSSCGSFFWSYSLTSPVNLSSAGPGTDGSSSLLTPMRYGHWRSQSQSITLGPKANPGSKESQQSQQEPSSTRNPWVLGSWTNGPGIHWAMPSSVDIVRGLW